MKRFFLRFQTARVLKRLIRGERILIVGSGRSASELADIPPGIKLFTCNAGIRFFDGKAMDRPLDLFFCNKAKLQREKEIELLLVKIRTRVFVSRNTDGIRENTALRGSYERLLYDDSTDPWYLTRLIRPQGVQDIQGRCEATWTSTGMRLLQYALYFGAREVYVVGMDFGENGYFWGPKPNPWGHPDIDENFIRIVSAKYRNVFSISSKSPLSHHLPVKRPA
ncbi:MAG: hypothetical protein HYZ52_04280 [Candidatus Omnitrophica bacterium]|nr:hypothetical protein [Candidatus Omnitrophota bacterium]